jgi:integron integrase
MRAVDLQRHPTVGLIDQLRDRIRCAQYSSRTERAYVFWVRRFVMLHRERHAREMGGAEVQAFLRDLGTRKRASVATRKQALAALLFFYRHVLGQDYAWMREIGRPAMPPTLPPVLTRTEVELLIAEVEPAHATLVSMIYGTGMRLAECLQLRVRDVDFDRRVIAVRGDGNSKKDRQVMLPRRLDESLQYQLEISRQLWLDDRELGLSGVPVPPEVVMPSGKTSVSWIWHWVFPAALLSVDPLSGIRRRHHVYPQTVSRAIAYAAALAELDRRVTAQTLRHSFAAHLLASGVDIRRVQELMGHRDVRTTMIYFHILRTRINVTSPLDSPD